MKVPPDQSLASPAKVGIFDRSVVKSEGKTSNGSPKPDGIKGAPTAGCSIGAVLNSEKCIVVVR